MSANDFETKLAQSREYEIALAKWLQAERGFYILPTYDYSGLAANKAPRLICEKHGLVIPDLLAAKDGTMRWCEVKTKESADLYRISNTKVTGMPKRHWLHYQEVKQLSGCMVFVFFIHTLEGVVLCDEISILAHKINHIYDGDKMDRGGTIFFRFDALSPLISKRELDAYKTA